MPLCELWWNFNINANELHIAAIQYSVVFHILCCVLLLLRVRAYMHYYCRSYSIMQLPCMLTLTQFTASRLLPALSVLA